MRLGPHHLIGRSLMQCLALSLTVCGALPLLAGESVVLNTGFRLQADRHEASGDQIKIYLGSGYVELPASSIAGFEPEDTVPRPVAVAPTATTKLVPTPAVPVSNPHELAATAARKYALPESFVSSVMKAESGFRVDALSPKGAIGLMQLMESTAKQLGVNPKVPRENAEGGARYLRELLAKYEHDPNQVILALAAYNAGPEAVERYHGVPPFRETREYILRVLRNWDRKAVQ